MAYNIAQVGVDKRTGAPIIEKKNIFTYNGDPNGKQDVFYYFGTRLGSSSFINPSQSIFLNVNKLTNNTVGTFAVEATDNNTDTYVFENSNNGSQGIQIRFVRNTFKLTRVQIHGVGTTWTIQGSEDENNWVNISVGASQNIGNGWMLFDVPNNNSYQSYRIIHGQEGTLKTLGSVKLFGTYNSSDISCSKENEAQYIVNYNEQEGVIFLPDALQENFPENYYCTFLCLNSAQYVFASTSNSTTSVVDNTNGKLTLGEQLKCLFHNGEWKLYKVGGEVDIRGKGEILGHNGSSVEAVPAGNDGQLLVRDNSTNTGLNWVDVSFDSQQFGSVKTTSFILTSSFNNQLIPIDTTDNNVDITLSSSMPAGYQVILFHYGGGEITINPNGQAYRGRGNKIVNNNAAITLTYDLNLNTWYAIGDLVQG